MKQFGLIGYPLSHSFSKTYFSKKFSEENILDCQYDNYPLESIDEFSALAKSNNSLKGINVTIPYKEQVIPFLDELDGEAKEIGAINTIQFSNGKMKGFNTDVHGFIESLRPLLPQKPIEALILGTGGASKAVSFGLKKLGIKVQFISRSANEQAISYNEANLDLIKKHLLIINTTPLGMYPNVDDCPPIAYGGISSEHILFDLVYNPEKTLFLQRGYDRGAVIKNGLEMLHLQAEKAWEIWNQI